MTALSVSETMHFFILGAMKAGTTSLARYLAHHRDVCLSGPKKETYFFETEEYHEGIEHYLRKYYPEWNGERVIGEASVSNLFLPFAAERLRENFPDARLICILRNPVDRAYSQWRMSFLFGLENLSFEDAVSGELERIRAGNIPYYEGEEGARLWSERMRAARGGRIVSKDYLARGYYARQIKRCLKLFPESQMRTVFFGDLVRDPQSVVSGLWDFLGVDPSFQLKDDTPRNPTYKNRVLYSLAKKISSAARFDLFMPAGIKARLTGIFAKIGKEQSMSGGTREKLIEHYYSHNRELEGLLGKDLSRWDR